MTQFPIFPPPSADRTSLHHATILTLFSLLISSKSLIHSFLTLSSPFPQDPQACIMCPSSGLAYCSSILFPTLPSWDLPTAEHCPMQLSSPATCSPICPFPKSSHPLPLVSSDWPVACGRGPQHGQPPLRLQHLRQSFQHHPRCHHHPGKRGFSGLQLQLPRVPPPQALCSWAYWETEDGNANHSTEANL